MRKSLPSCVETCNSHCREWKGREGGSDEGRVKKGGKFQCCFSIGFVLLV